MANQNNTKSKQPKQTYPPKDDTILFVSKLIKGRLYEGEILKRNGKPHGQGTMTYNPGSHSSPMYCGSWKQGKRDGNGEFKSDCYVYRGEWKKNRFHGKGLAGLLIFSHSGIFDSRWFRYEGEFTKGQFEYNKGSKYFQK